MFGSNRYPRHLLITGPPGCGKTTLLVRLARRLADRRPAGFYTEEMRERGRRLGFRLVSLDGQEGILAHVRFQGRQRVGRYGVDVPGFEAFLSSLDLLGSPAPMVFIDEVGKMECLSRLFIDTMRNLLDSERRVVATVALKGSGFIAQVKGRVDCEVILVSLQNRDRLLPDLEARIRRAE